MKLSLFRRQPAEIPHVPTASDLARALGKMGLAAQSDAAARQRAKVHAMARELCRCTGSLCLPHCKRRMPDMADATDDRLRNHVEALERLAEKIQGIRDDMKERFSLLKAEGYDAKIVRQVLKLRKMKPEDRREAEALLVTYAAGLGMEVQGSLF
jgi:uncharacterized protein (UPF0335 family)